MNTFYKNKIVLFRKKLFLEKNNCNRLHNFFY